jgi:flavin-binding protein dodecin
MWNGQRFGRLSIRVVTSTAPNPRRPQLVPRLGSFVYASGGGGLIRKVKLMKNHIYKVLELVGSSETSIEDAITTAIAQANKTVRNMDWFEVVHTRGHIENGKIGHYQVTLKIGFTLEA